MKITKYGHCCLLIEVEGVRILTDPGSYSEGYQQLENLDAVLITHEHPDHLHVDSLKEVLANNPNCAVISNRGVGKLLDEASIAYTVVADGETSLVKEILIEGLGTEHALIYPGLPQVENTGYFIAKTLFYPGDAFYNPQRPVKILALPVAGPWLKISEVIDYALTVKPTTCIPVHDGTQKGPNFTYGIIARILGEKGIGFVPLENTIATELPTN